MAVERNDEEDGGRKLEYRSRSRLEDEVEKVDRVRSQHSICQACPRSRSVLFLREHTFLKRDPAIITCPNCLCGIETVVERRNTIKTHLSALLLLPVCLCVLPYYSKVLRDTVHRCPACGIYLGSNFASARDAFVVCFGQEEQNNAGNDDDDQDEVVATPRGLPRYV